jgi:hypothetical protein
VVRAHFELVGQELHDRPACSETIGRGFGDKMRVDEGERW